MHRFLFIFLCSVLCLISLSSFCSGQSIIRDPLSAYHVTHFTDEDGLPQNSVKSITSDFRGNIWLATERGLARYDGNNFAVFDNFGRSFSNRNIASFHVAPGNAKDDFFAINDEKTFIRISGGKAYTDSSFYTSQLKAQPFSRPGLEGYLTEGLPSIHFNHVTPDYYIIPFGSDRYYVYDKEKLTLYRSKKTISSIALQAKNFWSFFRLNTVMYYLDRSALSSFDIKNGVLQQKRVRITGDITDHPLYGSRTPYGIFWNNASNQVFFVLGTSLYYLTPASDGDLHTELILDGFDFKGNSVTSVFFDQRAGRVLLGSQLNGLYVISKKSFKALTTNAKKTDNNYYGQIAYSDSTVLSSQGIVFGLSPDGKKMYSGQMQEITRHVDWDKYSILTDHQKKIWVRKDSTLFKFDPSGKRLLSKWLLPGAITQLHQGKDPLIWIGTKNSGLYFIDPSDPHSFPQLYLPVGHAGISWIQHQDPETLWLATSQGLYKLSLRSKKITSVKGLEDIYVRSLYIPEGRKEIWVTTYKDGIFLLQKDKLIRFPLDKNKFLASAHCIIEDRNGFFWVTTNKGLFQILRKDLLQYARQPFDIYYYHHIKTAGFNTNEFNGGCQPCGIRLKNGYVSFPSINGLVWFKPEDIKPVLPTADMYIESASAGNTPLKFASNRLLLGADASEVSLKMNIAYLGNPDNLKLSYQLTRNRKAVTGWRAINPREPDVLLPYLESGEYGFSIRKVNGFGARNYTYRKITISVAKKWHETWWFRLSAFTSLIILFYTALHARTRLIESQKLALETRVNERTRDLELILKALGNSEKQLEQQLRLHVHMIASVSHDIRTPMKYIGTALQYVKSRVEKNETRQAANIIQTMQRTISELDLLINNIVTFISHEIHQNRNDFQDVNLKELVSRRALIFKDILQLKGRNIDIRVPASLAVQTNPDLLGVILHNLIDNAQKAWPEGMIKVYTFRKDHDLHLVVADQGPGLPIALLQWLNNNEHSTSLPEQYNGLGFPMVKEISRLLHLRIYAENSVGAHIHLIFAHHYVQAGQEKSMLSFS